MRGVGGGGCLSPLHLHKSVFKLYVLNVPPTVLLEVPSQGVPPPVEDRPAGETLGLLALRLNMSFAFPPPSETLVAFTATPFRPNVVEHWRSLATASRFRCG